jgi:hypothetical protein
MSLTRRALGPILAVTVAAVPMAALAPSSASAAPVTVSAAAATTTLTTNSTTLASNGNTVPSGYSQVTAVFLQNHTVSAVTLPTAPRNGDKVTLSNGSPIPSTVRGEKLEIGTDFVLGGGAVFGFTYSSANKTWSIEALGSSTLARVTPKAVGGDIPAGARLTIFSMSNGDYASTITLPANARNNDQIVIESSTGQNGKIQTTNTDLAQVLTVRKDTRFSFVFDGKTNTWKQLENLASQK